MLHTQAGGYTTPLGKDRIWNRGCLCFLYGYGINRFSMPRLHEDVPSGIFHIFGCVIKRGLWSLQTEPTSLAFAHRRPEHGVVVANDRH